jgi:hypothetical protein
MKVVMMATSSTVMDAAQPVLSSQIGCAIQLAGALLDIMALDATSCALTNRHALDMGNVGLEAAAFAMRATLAMDAQSQRLLKPVRRKRCLLEEEEC